MNESDDTRNEPEDEPTEQSLAAQASWPQYTWPPASDVPTAATPADAPASAGASDPAWSAWPPSQPSPTTRPTVPAAGPYATDPYGTPPYATPPYATDPSAIPPYAAGPYAPPGWPPAPPSAPTTAAPVRRGLAALAAVALVLASAGVGAGVAIAVHNNSGTRSFDAIGRTSPSDNGGSLPTFGGGDLGGGNFGGGGATTNPTGNGTLDVNAIASKVTPALVNINTTLQNGRAAGTGMLISSTGEILTNNHVIADATTIKVVIGGTGPSHDAKVVGYDVSDDVALLQISDQVSNLPTITFGDPSKVQVGDPVVAIGNALGKGGTPSATQGHVTALDQQVTAGDGGGNSETLEGMIQINAPIQPGDSGGALVDRNGRVIGMNTAAAGGGRFSPQTGSDIGFAIPIDNAVNIVSQIRSGTDTDKVHIGDRGLLGVQVQDLDGQNAAVSSGALVTVVQDNSGAGAAGIKSGDVLVSVNGKPIANRRELQDALVKFHPGDSVKVGWVDSSGTQHSGSVTLTVGPPL